MDLTQSLPRAVLRRRPDLSRRLRKRGVRLRRCGASDQRQSRTILQARVPCRDLPGAQKGRTTVRTSGAVGGDTVRALQAIGAGLAFAGPSAIYLLFAAN
jgi:hypothetical protein